MKPSLIELLRPARAPRLLVVGDMILDRYQYGTTERISPEAPIPVLAATGEEHRLGGCGNVAASAAALGAQVKCVAVVGADDAAGRIRDLLRRAGLDEGGLVVDDTRPTIRKTRLVAHNQQLLRVDEERTTPLTAEVQREVLARMEEALDGSDVVVVSDYGKGFVSDAVLELLCRQPGRPRVLVDPKGRDFARYRGASLLTPNRAEAEAATGCDLSTVEGVRAAARRLCELADLEASIITLGSEGMFGALADGSREWSIPARARSVYDVTGAGDAVVATLAFALGAGADLERASHLANAAAGIAVQRFGAATVTPEDISGALFGASVASHKVLSQEQLLERVAAERKAGRRIVFTNGCFDVLHVGHLEYLQEASGHGDILVVAVNDDLGVRALKGPDRPVNKAADRAALLAGLECVSLVTIFTGDTPLELIEAVTPDVLVKGEDWSDKGVVGTDWVERHGGRVVLARLREGYSTTATLENLGRGGA